MFVRWFGEIDYYLIVNGMDEFFEIVCIYKVVGESVIFGVGWYFDYLFF